MKRGCVFSGFVLLFWVGMIATAWGFPGQAQAGPKDDLIAAIEGGNSEGGIAAIRNGCDVNRLDGGSGQTPLTLAVGKARLEMVKLLVENGADVNKVNVEGSTPLHMAAILGNSEILECLTAHGANANTRDVDGTTPLMEAALRGYERPVKLLLEKGAAVNEKTPGGTTALFVAAFIGATNIVDLLIEKGADVNARVNKAELTLILAALGGDSSSRWNIRSARRRGAGSEEDWTSVLMAAAGRGYIEVVKLLVEKGVNACEKNPEGLTALDFASKYATDKKGLLDYLRTAQQKCP